MRPVSSRYFVHSSLQVLVLGAVDRRLVDQLTADLGFERLVHEFSELGVIHRRVLVRVVSP